MSTTFIYQIYEDDQISRRYVYADKLPSDQSQIISGTIQVKTPFKDMTGESIYTKCFVKHYNGMDDPWAYDYGVVFEDSVAKCFKRTSTLPDKPTVNMSENCRYVILGDISESPLTLAVQLWFTLSREQREAWYIDTGIIGFLEDFNVNGAYLESQEIELALDLIEENKRIY